MVYRVNKYDIAVQNAMKLPSKEYPIREGVYSWVDAYSTGMVSRDKVPDNMHDSGSLFLEQKKLIGAGLCLRCEQKEEGIEKAEPICKKCRAEMFHS